MDHLIIVDCQYDFIDGSLACSHSREAVRNIIAFANANDVECMYTSDWHSKTNKSFKITAVSGRYTALQEAGALKYQMNLIK